MGSWRSFRSFRSHQPLWSRGTRISDRSRLTRLSLWAFLSRQSMSSVHTILAWSSSNSSRALRPDYTRDLGDSVVNILSLRVDGSENFSSLRLDISSQVSHTSVDSVGPLLSSLKRSLEPPLLLLFCFLLLFLFGQVLLVLLLLFRRGVANGVLAARELHDYSIWRRLGSTRGSIDRSSHHIAGELSELGLICECQLLRGNSVVSLLVKSTACFAVRVLS
mmetsp:Transcript_1217/g.2626  ORF Transcript_1217/g.2626 Transcript_1217/m.2626 type:complete len:220 (+) Transcript_1217:279-938(+)